MFDYTFRGIKGREIRVAHDRIYANMTPDVINKATGAPVNLDARHKQFDLAEYPEMAAAVATLTELVDKAYLHAEGMTADPGQVYIPPAPPEPEPAPDSK